MSVGERIVARRKALGMTRPALAAASGVKYPTLAGLENGDQAGSTQLHAIAEALQCSAQWLATGKEGVSEARLPYGPSQPVGLDVDKLTSLIETVEAAVLQSGRSLPPRTKARVLARLYMNDQAQAASSPESVRTLLASLLDVLE